MGVVIMNKKYIFPDTPDPVLEDTPATENQEMIAIIKFMESLKSGSFSLEKEESDETE